MAPCRESAKTCPAHWTPEQAIQLTDSLMARSKPAGSPGAVSELAEERVGYRRRGVGADALDQHREGHVSPVPDEPGVGRRVAAPTGAGADQLSPATR